MPQAEAQHLQEMTPGTSPAQQPPPPQRPKDGPWDFLKSWVWHVCKTAAATDARQTASLHFKCPEATEIRTPEPLGLSRDTELGACAVGGLAGRAGMS